MARGGRRQGAPGKTYGNRTDMQMGARQAPVMRVPGQAYGEQAEQVRAQQAIPMAPQPPIRPPAAPTQPVPLNAPTQRLNEPLTAGVDIGAGPPAPPQPLSANAEFPKQMIVALEALASLPDASDATRNLVRQLRSEL